MFIKTRKQQTNKRFDKKRSEQSKERTITFKTKRTLKYQGQFVDN